MFNLTQHLSKQKPEQLAPEGTFYDILDMNDERLDYECRSIEQAQDMADEWFIEHCEEVYGMNTGEDYEEHIKFVLIDNDSGEVIKTIPAYVSYSDDGDNGIDQRDFI